MSLADRSAGPVLPIGALAMLLVVVAMIIPNSSGAGHAVWVLSWTGFWLCGLALIAMAMLWTARQRRAGDLYHRSEKAASEDEHVEQPIAWPHPTAPPPVYHRKAS